LITVKGISTNPAKTLALAPAIRFCVLVNLGRTELLFLTAAGNTSPMDFVEALAKICRRELRVVKYSAEPKPVRSAEGTVPRQRLATGCGPARIDLRTGTRECERDCWTRVLSRSAGWRRTALDTPEVRPARKWKYGCALFVLETVLAAPLDMICDVCCAWSRCGQRLEVGGSVLDGSRCIITTPNLEDGLSSSFGVERNSK